MRLSHWTWIPPVSFFATFLLVSCGLGAGANLGDDSAPLQEGEGDDDDGAGAEPTPCGDAMCGVGESCCNASCGTCVKPGEACDLRACVPNEYDPCAGKVCGDECRLCAPDDTDCAEDAVIKYCDAGGTCAPTPPDCGEEPYDPCAGKSCGDPCTLCAPDDRDCAETADIKACDAEGQCRSGNAVCEAECWDPTLEAFCEHFGCPAPSGDRLAPGPQDAVDYFLDSGACEHYIVTLVTDSCGRETIGYDGGFAAASYEFITGTFAAATISSDTTFGPCNETSYYSTSDGSGLHLEGCDAWTSCEVCAPPLPREPLYPPCRSDCDCEAIDPGLDPCFAPDSCECYCQQISIRTD